MTKVTDSKEAVDLDLETLQLDIKALQQNHEEDRKEFQDTATCNKIFACIQTNFDKIQANFRKLLAIRIPDTEDDPAEASAQASGGQIVQLTETPQEDQNSYRHIVLLTDQVVLLLALVCYMISMERRKFWTAQPRSLIDTLTMQLTSKTRSTFNKSIISRTF